MAEDTYTLTALHQQQQWLHGDQHRAPVFATVARATRWNDVVQRMRAVRPQTLAEVLCA